MGSEMELSYKEEKAANRLLHDLGLYAPFPSGVMTDTLEKRFD